MTSGFPAIVLLMFFLFSLILSTLCGIKSSHYNNMTDVATIFNVRKLNFLCFDFHSSICNDLEPVMLASCRFGAQEKTCSTITTFLHG
jgi:hypothetical protein